MMSAALWFIAQIAIAAAAGTGNLDDANEDTGSLVQLPVQLHQRGDDNSYTDNPLCICTGDTGYECWTEQDAFKINKAVKAYGLAPTSPIPPTLPGGQCPSGQYCFQNRVPFQVRNNTGPNADGYNPLTIRPFCSSETHCQCTNPNQYGAMVCQVGGNWSHFESCPNNDYCVKYGPFAYCAPSDPACSACQAQPEYRCSCINPTTFTCNDPTKINPSTTGTCDSGLTCWNTDHFLRSNANKEGSEGGCSTQTYCNCMGTQGVESFGKFPCPGQFSCQNGDTATIGSCGAGKICLASSPFLMNQSSDEWVCGANPNRPSEPAC